MGMYSFRLPWSISQTGGRFIPNQEAWWWRTFLWPISSVPLRSQGNSMANKARTSSHGSCWRCYRNCKWERPHLCAPSEGMVEWYVQWRSTHERPFWHMRVIGSIGKPLFPLTYKASIYETSGRMLASTAFERVLCLFLQLVRGSTQQGTPP
jgi:hypothetical protein